jgi:hypothetical protein
MPKAPRKRQASTTAPTETATKPRSESRITLDKLPASELRRKAESTGSPSWAARFEALAVARERKDARNARARELRAQRREQARKDAERRERKNARARERRAEKRDTRTLRIDENGRGIGDFVRALSDEGFQGVSVEGLPFRPVDGVSGADRGRLIAEYLYEQASMYAPVKVGGEAPPSNYYRPGPGLTKLGAQALNSAALAAITDGVPFEFQVRLLR